MAVIDSDVESSVTNVLKEYHVDSFYSRHGNDDDLSIYVVLFLCGMVLGSFEWMGNSHVLAMS
jgi:hypothetical protein